MRKHAASSHIQVPPLSAIHTSDNKTTENPASPLQWTGNAIDLVELIYGINEMGCINNGNMPLERHIAVVDTTHFVDAVDKFHEVDGVARPLQGRCRVFGCFVVGCMDGG